MVESSRRGIVAGLLLAAVSLAPGCDAEPDCFYAARPSVDDPQPEFESHGNCARVRGDAIEIGPEHLAALEYDDGLASLLVGTRWVYASPEGRVMAVLTVDNGADDFAEGLARTRVGNRVGFIDRELLVAIPARFDFAWPFEDGTALVCMECRSTAADDDGHSSVIGGRWGYTDRSGEVVVPIALSREAARSARPQAGPGADESMNSRPQSKEID